MKKLIQIIEAVTGLSGFGIMWWQHGFWTAFAIFLILTSLYQKMELNLIRLKS